MSITDPPLHSTVSRAQEDARESSRSRDIFEKCNYVPRLREGRAAGLYMYFTVFGDREGCGPSEILVNGRKVLMFGSNDYLALTTHPKVKEAAAAAVSRYGTGCGGSRLLNGTLDLHVRLEAELASFLRKEAALTFGTGFQTNYAVLSCMGEKGDVLLCDHNLHASLVEGALGSRARLVRFRHNDVTHLQRCLEDCAPSERVLIVSEGVFSMEGDIAELPGIVPLARRYEARLYVDEAHGIGVLGPNGAGVAEQQGLLDHVDIVMGTFSKSLASVGGFIAGPQVVIDYLRHTARPFIFSASLPPASIEAARAALGVLRSEPERRERVQATAALLRRELRSIGFSVPEVATPIVPIFVEDPFQLSQMCVELLEAGIYVNPVLRPAATRNLIRISCTAAHTEDHVERLVESMIVLAEQLGIRTGADQNS